MAVGLLWGHDGCDSRWRLKLTSCPRHPGTQLREMTMPKITRHGGPTNFGLTERDAGFVTPSNSVPAEWVRPQNQADADLQDGAPALIEPESDERVSTDDDDEDESAPEREATVGTPPFDPGEYSVADVVADLPGLSPAERHAVIEAERAGRGRVGILNAK